MNMSLSKLQSWRWTWKLGVLQYMGSERVGDNRATELTKLNHISNALVASVLDRAGIEKFHYFRMFC